MNILIILIAFYLLKDGSKKRDFEGGGLYGKTMRMER